MFESGKKLFPRSSAIKSSRKLTTEKAKPDIGWNISKKNHELKKGEGLSNQFQKEGVDIRGKFKPY